MKNIFFTRIEKSDVKAGTYIIVAAEGIKEIKGELLYDDTAGVDAFGHKKLAGAGKYVRQQLEKMLKNDPEVKEFMKRTGMFAPGVYETPEVREVSPGHLVRSGQSSAYDVNFGQKAGAAAVMLLLEGKSGNTVVDVNGKKIYFQSTEEVIKHREVDLNEVALFESMGICFGRKPQKYEYEIIETKGLITRHI
jgi:6-phosphofructokinase 1